VGVGERGREREGGKQHGGDREKDRPDGVEMGMKRDRRPAKGRTTTG